QSLGNKRIPAADDDAKAHSSSVEIAFSGFRPRFQWVIECPKSHAQIARQLQGEHPRLPMRIFNFTGALGEMLARELMRHIKVRNFNQDVGTGRRSSSHQLQAADRSQKRSATAVLVLPSGALFKAKRPQQRRKAIEFLRRSLPNQREAANHSSSLSQREGT